MHDGEFDEFYTASYRRLTSQLYAMIGDLDEAQECVQVATFVGAATACVDDAPRVSPLAPWRRC